MELATTMRSSLANAYNSAINTGSGTAVLKLRTSTPTDICSFNLQNPAFTEDSGVLTCAGTPITSSSVSGTPTVNDAVITDRDSNIESTLGVNTSGSPDLTLSTLTPGDGDTYSLTSWTITVPQGSPTTS